MICVVGHITSLPCWNLFVSAFWLFPPLLGITFPFCGGLLHLGFEHSVDLPCSTSGLGCLLTRIACQHDNQLRLYHDCLGGSWATYGPQPSLLSYMLFPTTRLDFFWIESEFRCPSIDDKNSVQSCITLSEFLCFSIHSKK